MASHSDGATLDIDEPEYFEQFFTDAKRSECDGEPTVLSVKAAAQRPGRSVS